MSLAVRAVIAPSRRLRCLLAAFCASLCAAAVAVGLLLPGRFACGGAVAVLPLLAALSLVRGHAAGGPSRGIDISGLGHIRLTVQQQLGQGAPAPATSMTLLPGATVWPCCIVLRLRADDGAVRPLVLLPDMMGAGQYRALAVAVRALAAGGAPPSPQNTLNLLPGVNS